MDDLGVELDAIHAAIVRKGRHRRVAAGGERVEARRQLGDMVAVAHPHRKLAVEAFEQAVRLADREKGGAVLAGRARVDLAAEVMGDQLHSVADAQHRNAGAQRLRVDLRRAGLVDARRPAREDEAGRLPALQLVPWRRAWHELAVHARLANATRDELAVLRTEIQDEDRLASLPALRLRP